MSYFAIEHDQKCIDHIVLKDKDGNVAFGDYLNLTYGEMKSREDLDEFVVAIFGAVNNSDNSQTLVTLVGDDDVFIWSIIIGLVDEDLRYILVDWKKDGKSYRYEPENKDLTN
jgi:hypothetical protein